MNEPDVRDDLLGRALDYAVRDLHPTPDVASLVGIPPRRQVRRTVSALVVAAAFVGLVVVAASIVGDRTPSAGDGVVEDPVRQVDPIDGVSVEVPFGWQVADQNLTPWLAEPGEILSVGTFPMPVSEDPDDELRVFDAPVAPAALAQMGPQDAFVSVQETESTAAEARPASFRTADGHPCCSGTSGDYPFRWWWFQFTDRGRGLYLFVAIGNEAPADIVDDAWSVADSLRFEPNTSLSPAP